MGQHFFSLYLPASFSVLILRDFFSKARCTQAHRQRDDYALIKNVSSPNRDHQPLWLARSLKIGHVPGRQRVLTGLSIPGSLG